MKFSTLALLGSAEAYIKCNHRHHCTKNLKAITIDLLYKPITGAHIQDMCPAESQEYMETGKFWRAMLRATHVHGVEALYGETGFIDDECFGEWMEPAWKPVHDIAKKIKDDVYTTTYEDW